MSAIQNLHSLHPFTDARKGDGLLPAGTEEDIHMRIQQRNGRKKTLTTVQEIADDDDEKKLVKAFKKKSACNGTVSEHSEYGEEIQLQGDQRKNTCRFLMEIGLAKDDHLTAHGFSQNEMRPHSARGSVPAAVRKPKKHHVIAISEEFEGLDE
ncbi:eukaryotic translation initiation factor 1-like [Apodemus sylvaticus]|uniref:eukaryotic translation initiation factor 1-like n=1 Tax=Apodemus sylvaticus TaxID=10129 RepID=UPI0022422A0E|nr:eukaryotic translation initiation factor 1-like [Apodemus sylvaticus]